jgi:maltose O-acetyltransferase
MFLRHFFFSLGKGNTFYSGLRVTSPHKVSIGSNCNFDHGVFITGGGGVQIGDWVGFGPDVKVWSVNHRFDDPDTPWLLQGWKSKPVVIDDDVWLGANVFVMPGVTIGKGAIVSACALIDRSIPPYAIVAGNPCRVVGWRRRPTDSESTDNARLHEVEQVRN